MYVNETETREGGQEIDNVFKSCKLAKMDREKQILRKRNSKDIFH